MKVFSIDDKYVPRTLCLVALFFAALSLDAQADQFEELHKSTVADFQASLDDRLIPVRKKEMEEKLAWLQDRLTRLRAITPSKQQPANKEELDLLDRDSLRVIADCDSAKSGVFERLNQAIRRESDRLSAFPDRIADAAQWAAYWNTHTRRENFKLLSNYYVEVQDLQMLDMKADSLASQMIELSPPPMIKEVTDLIKSLLTITEHDCREYQLIAELYIATRKLP